MACVKHRNGSTGRWPQLPSAGTKTPPFFPRPPRSPSAFRRLLSLQSHRQGAPSPHCASETPFSLPLAHTLLAEQALSESPSEPQQMSKTRYGGYAPEMFYFLWRWKFLTDGIRGRGHATGSRINDRCAVIGEAGGRIQNGVSASSAKGRHRQVAKQAWVKNLFRPMMS